MRKKSKDFIEGWNAAIKAAAKKVDVYVPQYDGMCFTSIGPEDILDLQK